MNNTVNKDQSFKQLKHAQHITESRLLDVHRWSDHPAAKVFIDHLWAEFTAKFPSYLPSSTARGPKPKSTNKKHFKVVMLDLYVCWNQQHDQWLSVSFSPKDYDKVGSRYNALFMSSRIIQMIKDMESIGWVDIILGMPNPDNIERGQGYVTRFRATSSLVEYFTNTELTPDNCPVSPDKEVIILTTKDDLHLKKEGGKAPRIEYEDTAETVEMRGQLKAYNALIAETRVDLGADSPDFLTQPSDTDPDHRIRIRGAGKHVERIFSRGSFEKHGRFYGGFWQQLNEDNRKLIHIDGNPTVEVDFKALHIKLIYALNDIYSPYEEDPYLIDWPESIRSISEDQYRSVVKGLMLFCINAKTLRSAFQSFRNDQKQDTPEKKLKNSELQLILECFLLRHPVISDYIGQDAGINLMNVDGKMTAEIMRLLTGWGIPVLTIHDSYIVQKEHFPDLRSAMAMASIRIAGRDILAVQDGIVSKREDGYNNYKLVK